MSDTTKSSEQQKEKEMTAEKLLRYQFPDLKLTAGEKKELDDYYNLSEEERKNKKEKIEKKFKPKVEKYQKERDQELIQAPKSSIFRGFDETPQDEDWQRYLEKKVKKEKEKGSVFNREQVRILVSRVLSNQPRLRAFFEKHCILEYNPKPNEWNDPDATGGAIITQVEEKGEKKFKIEVDSGSFMSELSSIDPQTKKPFSIRYLDPIKFAFIIGQALSRLISPSEKVIEILKKSKVKEKIDENSVSNWSEFVTLCITDPEAAQKINPTAYTEVETVLESFDFTPKVIDGRIVIKDPKINYDYIYKDRPKTERKLKLMDRFWNWIGWEPVFRKGVDWAERAKAEYDLKEVSRIIARDEGIGQRDKRLKELIQFKDKNNCRRLIMADSMTGDIARWRFLIYAWTFDPLFRKTKGKKITEETFDLFQRCRRISETKKRVGTKPMDYKKDPTTGEYVRIDSKKYQREVDKEWEKKSDRESQATLQETYEHMIVNGKFVDIDEKLGDNWYVSTGDLREILGAGEAENFLKDIRSYAEAQGDLDWIAKLEPDQRAAIARFHITANRGGPAGAAGSPAAREANLYHEHTKPITREAFLFYEHKISSLKEKQEIEVEAALKEMATESPEDFLQKGSQEEIRNVFNNLKTTKEKTRRVVAIDIVSRNFQILDRKLRATTLPEKVKMFLLMKFDFLKTELDPQKPINIQTDEFKKELDRLLESYPDQQSQTYKVVDDFLKELKNLKVIKDYERVFKPFEKAVERLEVPDEKTKDAVKKYFSDLLPKLTINGTRVADAIKEINEKFKGKEGKKFIKDPQKEKILASDNPVNELNNVIERKLKITLQQQKEIITDLYEKEAPFSERLSEWKKIEAAPQEDWILKNINNNDDLDKYLGISYFLLLNRIDEEEKKKKPPEQPKQAKKGAAIEEEPSG